eukprot:2896436-Ditylum_brightwellii.AAC.1
MIKQESTTMWEETDDRAVGAPGHGKYIVDGLNATDKAFKKAMFHSKNPEQDHTSKDMIAHYRTQIGR